MKRLQQSHWLLTTCSQDWPGYGQDPGSRAGLGERAWSGAEGRSVCWGVRARKLSEAGSTPGEADYWRQKRVGESWVWAWDWVV